MSWADVMVNNYGTPPITLVSGRGSQVTDDQGRTYTDLVAGIAVNVLGHAHPAVVAAVQEQVAKLAHTSNLYAHPQGLRLAARLQRLTHGHKTMFVNSGTEANEAALKTMRKKAHDQGRDAVVVAFTGSFHGRTLGALALTGQPHHQTGFGPLPGGIVHVPFNDPAVLEAAFDAHDVVGVMAECVQGEGGVKPMDADTAATLARLTAPADVLLAIDEVQTGVGRTGKFHAHEAFGLRPDIVTMAKGLGGGLPIGAAMFGPDADVLGPGAHGCTFGGNAVAAAAANAVLDVLTEDRLADRAHELGECLQERLRDGGRPARGMGLLVGVPSDEPAPEVAAMREAGFLVGVAGKQTVRLAPPLNIGEDHLWAGADQLCAQRKS